MSIPTRLSIKVFRRNKDLALPAYETEQAAAADIRADIPVPVTVQPGGRHVFDTGLFPEIPPGWKIQVLPRSGFARKQGVTVLNSPGTIDADFRNEIGVLLINLSDEPVTVNPGDRIAQIDLQPVVQMTFEEVGSREELSTSTRGAGGWESTGRN